MSFWGFVLWIHQFQPWQLGQDERYLQVLAEKAMEQALQVVPVFFAFFFLCQKKRIDRLFIRHPKNSFLCHLWGFCATSSWAELESLEVSVLGCLWGMDTSHARKGPGHELKHLEAFSFHFSSLVWCIAFRCVSKLRSFIYIYTGFPFQVLLI